LGKITQYLETYSVAEDGSEIRSRLESLRLQLANLEAELDNEALEDRLTGFLNIIGRYMTDYSTGLNLEHKGSQLRLDLKKLTVIADTLDGSIPLYRMGSGENWVGYHILAMLSIHKWFRLRNRPVPGFLIIDQPSQAHYPPDQVDDRSISDLEDEDKIAVSQLYELLNAVAVELHPNLQIIVTDHVKIDEPWFREATLEEWRQSTNSKLLPRSWVNEDEWVWQSTNL